MQVVFNKLVALLQFILCYEKYLVDVFMNAAQIINSTINGVCNNTYR